MAKCDRCGTPIADNAERCRVRLSRSWFEGYKMQGCFRKRIVERSRGIVTGTLCAECAEVVGKAIEEAMEVVA